MSTIILHPSLRLRLLLPILLIFCGCDSAPEKNPALPARSITGTSRITSSIDSLLNRIDDRLRRRRLEDLDSLIGRVETLSLPKATQSSPLAAQHYHRARRLRGDLLWQLEEKEGYLQHWQSAEREARRELGAAHWVLAEFYLSKAIFFAAFNTDSALAYGEKALQITDGAQVDRPQVRASIYQTMANAHFAYGDVLLGLQLIEKALAEATRPDVAPDSILLGNIYNTRAALHYSFLEYEETARDMELFRQTKVADPFFEARFSGNLAIVYYALQDNERAIELNGDAIRNYLSQEPVSWLRLADNYGNQGQFYLSNEQYDSAAVQLEKALDIRLNKTVERPLHIAGTHAALAHIYLKSKKAGPAQHHFNRAKELFSNLNPDFSAGLGVYYLYTTHFYRETGNLPLALQECQKALCSAMRSPTLLPADQNPPLIAIHAYEEALQAYVLKVQLLLQLAVDTRTPALLDQCIATCELAMELVDHLRSSFHYHRYRSLVSGKAHIIYATGIQAAVRRFKQRGDPADPELALRFSTRSKAGMLRDRQQELKALDNIAIPPALRRRELLLQQGIWRTETALNLLESTADTLRKPRINALKDSLHQLSVRYAGLRSDLLERYPAYNALALDTTRLRLSRLRASLGDSITLIDVFEDSSSLYLFALNKTELKLQQVVLTPGLRQQLAVFRANITLAESDYAAFCSSAFGLYNQLLKPFEALLPTGQQLLIIPDKTLCTLPFAALLTAPADTGGIRSYADLPYLLNRHSVRYLYSADLLHPQRDAAERPAENSFLAYAPGFSDGIPAGSAIAGILGEFNKKREGYPQINGPLPYSEDEVRAIRNLFLNRFSSLPSWLSGWFSHSVLRLGRQATEQQLLQEELTQYRYIHFSAHGFFYEKNPALSGLLLYPAGNTDGILFPGDIYRLQLNADLVVLSACQTGLGKWNDGEGLIGPAQAFLQAGARNLLVSLWQTENRSAGILMPELYRHLLNGHTLPQALQQAQQHLLHSEDFQHPGFWAVYSLIGQ